MRVNVSRNGVSTFAFPKTEFGNEGKAAIALFSGDIASLPVKLLKQMARDVASITWPFERLLAEGPPTVIDLLVETKACTSKSDARRQIGQNGVRINGKPPAEGENPKVTLDDFLEGEVIVLQRGKRNNYLVILAKT